MASQDSNLSVCRHLNGEVSAHLVQIEIIFVLELTEYKTLIRFSFGS